MMSGRKSSGCSGWLSFQDIILKIQRPGIRDCSIDVNSVNEGEIERKLGSHAM